MSLKYELTGFIELLQIDEEVIKACRTHMRTVCGSSMDQLEGPNYKVQDNLNSIIIMS